MGPGIDKAQSLDALAKKLNIKQEEVIAFGDGYNDQAMFREVGHVHCNGECSRRIKTKSDIYYRFY